VEDATENSTIQILEMRSAKNNALLLNADLLRPALPSSVPTDLPEDTPKNVSGNPMEHADGNTESALTLAMEPPYHPSAMLFATYIVLTDTKLKTSHMEITLILAPSADAKSHPPLAPLAKMLFALM
jgi:hypothetical protein